MIFHSKLLPVLPLCILLTACGSSGTSVPDTDSSSEHNGNVSLPETNPPATNAPDNSSPTTPEDTVTPPAQNESPVVTSKPVALNQVGYLPTARKSALVPSVAATRFELVDKNNVVVYTGDLSAATTWSPSADEEYKLADFSDFTTTGEYQLKVAGVADSHVFSIDSTLYTNLTDLALKAFYYNRASTEILPEQGGDWARPAGHADTNIIIHESAATTEKPAGTVISGAKGWYDAGDFGKYVVNSGIATYTLLAAYEHHSHFFMQRDINIPESGDNVPDILDEVKWNLDWLQNMQDSDGGVYHKLTTLGWPGIEMPNADNRTRYVIGKSTAATLNFAAVLAQASRVYKPFYPELSEQWLTAAKNAWQWAQVNPNVVYQQPSDVQSGQYGDRFFHDEFRWAATELYISSDDLHYLNELNRYQADSAVPSWGYVKALSDITLAHQDNADFNADAITQARTNILSMSDTFYQEYVSSAFAIPMSHNNFVWGSNAVALNKAMILQQAYTITHKAEYKEAALSLVDYILGRNPTGYSFVTGVGSYTPMHIHHRASAADNVSAPIPGLLAGGPHNGKQDGCQYSADAPAMTYLDDWCSYSTNEVAINWNAPLVYMFAALSL